MKAVNDFKEELGTAVVGLPLNYSQRATEIVVRAGGDQYPIEAVYLDSNDPRSGKAVIVIEIDPKEAT